MKLPPLPEPAYGDCDVVKNADMSGAYTADQLRERDQQILRLCIAECERLSVALDSGGREYRREATASQCAAALRSALAAKAESEGKGERNGL